MGTSGEDLLITGAWLLGIGTVVEAIGQTQQTLTGTDLGKDLIIKGNGIEAVGNSLQAIARTKLFNPEEYPLSQLYYIFGEWVEAAGNTANSVGISIELSGEEEEGLKIDTLGSGIQGLGAAFEAVAAYIAEESSFKSLDITGNSLVSLGSFLDAIGNLFILQDNREIGEMILLIGAWLQVIGAFILIRAVTMEVEADNAPENGGDNPYSYHHYHFAHP
ncbi:DUF6944 family repetitive protein [Peribacillus sp. NPDC097264]|uniref:DUF6944 family repetitive protein n=1 Tax=Peribacillus sp. NPDC097264 TaxID=3390616 RepID=UPI003D02B938